MGAPKQRYIRGGHVIWPVPNIVGLPSAYFGSLSWLVYSVGCHVFLFLASSVALPHLLNLKGWPIAGRTPQVALLARSQSSNRRLPPQPPWSVFTFWSGNLFQFLLLSSGTSDDEAGTDNFLLRFLYFILKHVVVCSSLRNFYKQGLYSFRVKITDREINITMYAYHLLHKNAGWQLLRRLEQLRYFLLVGNWITHSKCMIRR